MGKLRLKRGQDIGQLTASLGAVGWGRRRHAGGRKTLEGPDVLGVDLSCFFLVISVEFVQTLSVYPLSLVILGLNGLVGRPLVLQLFPQKSLCILDPLVPLPLGLGQGFRHLGTTGRVVGCGMLPLHIDPC